MHWFLSKFRFGNKASLFAASFSFKAAGSPVRMRRFLRQEQRKTGAAKTWRTPAMHGALLFAVIFLFSCKHDETPDVSGIKTDVQVLRFDRDFFSMDTTQLQASLQALETKYPAFLSLYFKFFAPVREIAEQNNLPFDSALKEYIRLIRPLYATVEKQFSNTQKIEEGLEDNFRYIKHYFPSFQTPTVLTTVESLNPENPNEIYGTTFYQDTLIISLQMFLGKNYPVYDPTQYPAYIRRRFEPEFIVPNSIRAIVGDIYPDTSQSASLVEQMIENGKQWWLMKKFLPNTPDSLITGYSTQQMNWVTKEEGNVWGFLNQNENLYSIEQAAIQSYIGEAPFTQTLPHGNNGEGAPGNIGPWIGWQIIKKYEEEKPKLTVQQILRTPAKKIFAEAKYKPK